MSIRCSNVGNAKSPVPSMMSRIEGLHGGQSIRRYGVWPVKRVSRPAIQVRVRFFHRGEVLDDVIVRRELTAGLRSLMLELELAQLRAPSRA